MRIALAQINTTVGDLAGNRDLILDTARRGGGRRRAPDRVSRTQSHRLSSRATWSRKPSFLERTGQQLDRLAAETS